MEKPIYTLGNEVIKNCFESNISISTDKKYFAVGSVKGEIFIFNVKTGQVIYIFCIMLFIIIKFVEKIENKSGASISITSVQWRPYNSQLYVCDNLGFLTVWGY